MIETYQQAMEEFEKGDVIYAGKNLVKQNFYIHNPYGLQDQFLCLLMVIFRKDIMVMQ